MDHDAEPCAALPKTHLSVFATWCEVHQAWTLTHHVYLADGDTTSDVAPYTRVEFGPFDDLSDVLVALSKAAAVGLGMVRR